MIYLWSAWTFLWIHHFIGVSRKITKFANQIKTTLPTQCTSITVLINKHLSATLDLEFIFALTKSHIFSQRMKRCKINDAFDAERDQVVFYLFYVMMCIRNYRIFTWCSMFNVPAILTDADKNMPFYFGIFTSQRAMKKKFNGIVPYHNILIRKTEKLS